MRPFVLSLLALVATNPSRAGADDKAQRPVAPGETERVRWATAPPAERGPIASGAMKDNPTIDADWDKAAWRGVLPVTLDYYMGEAHQPTGARPRIAFPWLDNRTGLPALQDAYRI